MGPDDAIERRLMLARRERPEGPLLRRCGPAGPDGFTAAQHPWVLAEMVLHDIDRVDNVSVLGTDALAPHLHSLTRIPTAQALRDFPARPDLLSRH